MMKQNVWAHTHLIYQKKTIQMALNAVKAQQESEHLMNLFVSF